MKKRSNTNSRQSQNSKPQRQENKKMKGKGLLVASGIFLLLGFGSVQLSQKVICLFGECMLITSGDNLFNAKGTKIDSGMASVIGTLPMITFGISGACLIAGLVKSSSEN
jgi:hypothetical protein